MSIVINTNPSGKPSVHDNLWHVASSDNSGVIDMKYVFDVWINGEQKIRVKQFPEPGNGRAYFDAGPTVRNYMEYAWFEPIDTSVLVAQPDLSGQIALTYELRVGEDVSGVTTSNLASASTVGYNWAPPMFARRVTTVADKENKWLTNRPLTASTKIGENMFAGFYLNDASGYIGLNVERFAHDNSSQGTTSTLVAVTSTRPFLQLNIGTTAILATTSLSITDTTRYYDIWVNSNEKMRVYLSCNEKYTPYPVHFLNRWGLWDTIRFDLASRLSMDIERKGFGKRDYEFNGNSVDYMSSANRYYEGKINYSNKSTWNYKLNTNVLTDSEWEWLAELFASPQILVEIGEYFYPATIKKTNYDYVKFINDKLKPLEVEFDFNSERYTQLR